MPWFFGMKCTIVGVRLDIDRRRPRLLLVLRTLEGEEYETELTRDLAREVWRVFPHPLIEEFSGDENGSPFH